LSGASLCRCELGAQTKFDEKTGTAIVNGAHDAKRLSELIEGFIKRFVQCHACGNPETEVQITKQEAIDLQCKACGNVSHVDMRHKLCTFILKNPPEKKGKVCRPHTAAAAAPLTSPAFDPAASTHAARSFSQRRHARGGDVTLRARWVTLRARWVTLTG
jgi:hypothetical protein